MIPDDLEAAFRETIRAIEAHPWPKDFPWHVQRDLVPTLAAVARKWLEEQADKIVATSAANYQDALAVIQRQGEQIARLAADAAERERAVWEAATRSVENASRLLSAVGKDDCAGELIALAEEFASRA